MTTYGTTPTGFVPKPREAILEEIAATQRATIDPMLDTSPDSVVGKLNAVVADQFVALWQNEEALYCALSRLSDGDALDAIGALNGTPRKGATKSTVVLTLHLAPHSTVPAGSIVSMSGDPSVRVVTTADATSGDTALDVPVAAQAETAGAFTAASGLLTTIETPVAGWLTATNAASLADGTNIESDDDYRLRQIAELAAGGGGTLRGIRADLLKVAGVVAAEVLENVEDRANSDGMPGHSVEAIVQGGTADAIAAALFASRSAGVCSFGSEPPVTVTLDGRGYPMRFTRPIEIDVYLAVAITVDADIYDATSSHLALRSALVAASLERSSGAYLTIGGAVYAAQLVRVVLSQPGVIDAQVGIATSSIALPTDGVLSIPITTRQIARLDLSRITVSSV